MNKKNAFINRYPAKLFVFWENIFHAQLLNVADELILPIVRRSSVGSFVERDFFIRILFQVYFDFA
jgi:hypothetical protein